MQHINDFTIGTFRGLRDLKIENLGQVNLFVGNNNSGKTSVLEAFSLFCDPLNWRRWYDIGSQRELPNTLSTSPIDRLIWLFPSETLDNHNLSSESTRILLSALGNAPIKQISASYEKFTAMIKSSPPPADNLRLEDIIEEREIAAESLRINVSGLPKPIQPTLFEGGEATFQQTLTFSDFRPLSSSSKRQSGFSLPSQIVNPFSHRTSGLTSQLWSEVVEANLKTETIDLLQFFDPAIQDVDFISPTERRSLISIKHEKLGRAPLHTFGDGLRRVFTLAATIPRVRGGLLLIDELETAIHTKALEKTFDWLVKACTRNNIQLLATTHSLEALDAILEASREQADFVVYRLQQGEGQTTAKRFDKEMTIQLREELGMEMR
jgi:AAA domain, putative AbiEii toxin, Type IV TA system